MKVLFLDFDGVLNSAAWFKKYGDDRPYHIDYVAVKRLNSVIRRTGCKVVISSSWRIGRDKFQLERILHQFGFRGDVIDVTPRMSTVSTGGGMIEPAQRGHEIQAWLLVHPKVSRFAIVDDNSDMAHLRPYLVKTDWETGLLDRHVKALIDMLGERK